MNLIHIFYLDNIIKLIYYFFEFNYLIKLFYLFKINVNGRITIGVQYIFL